MMKNMGQFNVMRQDGLSIHTYQCPEDSEMVNAHILETPNKVILIDTQQFLPYAQELRLYVNHLNKPIDRVIITHSHPDHWMGAVCFEDLPIYALEETRDEIAAIGDYLLEFKRKISGDVVPDHKVIPTHTLNEGDLNIDGLYLRFSKVLDTEMAFMLCIELPDQKILLAQDLVYNHVYPCVGEKNAAGLYLFDGWINQLQLLKKKNYSLILPGHGEPCGPNIFDEMIGYIQTAKSLFESDVDDKTFKQTLMEKYPDYRVEELLDISNLYLYHRDW